MHIQLKVIFAIILNFMNGFKNIQCIYEDSEQVIDFDATKTLYTNKWVVHIEEGENAAKKLAEKHNFVFHGAVGTLPHLYHLEHKDVHKVSENTADKHHSLLEKHPKIRWVQQQKILSRKKRGYLTDPLFNEQWYLKNNGATIQRCKKYGKEYERNLDINVLKCWKKNITGAGIVVSILDDGLEYKHPDLQKNYDPEASFDYNDHDNDPYPRYSPDNINKHGTRCAGEVAAEANNGVCGTGVAFDAKVGGVRMLDGDVTDAVEAASLTYAKQHIDIYSSSWGPDDDGRTVDGPGALAKRAFSDGIKKGRKGRGSIFVWATGNGGRYEDYCSCDGYINSIYTIAIGAVDNCGRKPWYAEECPGTLAVTYSSGEVTGLVDKQISTTDIHFKCTSKHTGTSAAAPLAAGIFALVLQANPRLTWRDMQNLVVSTSKVVSPDDKEWQRNAANYMVNPKFGFGALDAGALVDMATSENWTTSPPLHTCETQVSDVNLNLRAAGIVMTSMETDGCASDKSQCVSNIEQVHVVIMLDKKDSRGQLEIDLVGPSGTKSQILRQRVRDRSRNGFQNWAFLTVFHWGESPKGKWTLQIRDFSTTGGVLKSWYLKFYGTCDKKKFQKNDKKKLKHPEYNISISDEEICGDVCKRGCPRILSEHCFECSHFCDCTIGECVTACDALLVADDQLRHCKRNMDSLNYIPNNQHNEISSRTTGIAVSLPVKFAIICLALIAVSALVAGVGYFASRMRHQTLQKGYHSLPRYSHLEGTVDEAQECGEHEQKLLKENPQVTIVTS